MTNDKPIMLPVPMKPYLLETRIPADALQVPMVVIVYVKGDPEEGLILDGEQQVTIKNAEVHATVKMLRDPAEFDITTLLLFERTARLALDAMLKSIKAKVQ